VAGEGCWPFFLPLVMTSWGVGKTRAIRYTRLIPAQLSGGVRGRSRAPRVSAVDSAAEQGAGFVSRLSLEP
jgi:hypothetical protein